jgi:hypothetical protein
MKTLNLQSNDEVKSSVMPAKAGTQDAPKTWIPVFMGLTTDTGLVWLAEADRS